MAPTRPQFDKMQEKTVQPQETDKPLEQQLAEAHAKAESNREVMLRALADAESTSAEASIGRWEHDLDPSVKAACEETFGDLLPAFGY